MDKLPDNIEKILDKIDQEAKPISIFIYGSRARTDYKEQSDFEIGVLFNRNKKWSRNKLSSLVNIAGVNVYPFIFEDFEKYKIDTPFPKAIYLREIITGAITVRGNKILENMKSPEVKLSDLIEEIIFQTAYALGAVLSMRQGDVKTASTEFIKSVLFGARTLIILEKGKFPLTYDEIHKEILNLKILNDEDENVVLHAIEVRNGKSLNNELLYKNITFLNQNIYQRIKKMLVSGDSVVLEGAPLVY